MTFETNAIKMIVKVHPLYYLSLYNNNVCHLWHDIFQCALVSRIEVPKTNSPMVHLTLLSNEGDFSKKIYILPIIGPFVIYLGIF